MADFVNFVENAIGVFPIAKEKATDLPSCFSRFTSQKAAIGKLFQRTQAIEEFFEPLRSSDWGSIYDPILDLVGIVLRRFSENDLVGHVFFETRFQTVSEALCDRRRRLRVRA